eukprot:3941389-Rhodomonas_salina.1
MSQAAHPSGASAPANRRTSMREEAHHHTHQPTGASAQSEPAHRPCRCPAVRATDRDRETDRDRDRDRETERQRDRERQRQRDRETERQRQTQRDRDTETQRQTQRHRDTETQRHRDTETPIHRYTETQRHRYTWTQRHRYTETQRQRETERETPEAAHLTSVLPQPGGPYNSTPVGAFTPSAANCTGPRQTVSPHAHAQPQTVSPRQNRPCPVTCP